MKRASTPILFPAILLALSGPAGAATWQTVQGNDRSVTQFDTESIMRRDGMAVGWLQQTHAKRIAVESGAFFYRTMKVQVRYHCADRMATVVARAYFDDDGSEVRRTQAQEDTRPILPE